MTPLFRGWCSTLDKWSGKIAKRMGTQPSALHSNFHVWSRSRSFASFLMLKTSKIEGVSQNSFVFDVVKFKIWRSFTEFLRFWCCQAHKLKKSHRTASPGQPGRAGQAGQAGQAAALQHTSKAAIRIRRKFAHTMFFSFSRSANWTIRWPYKIKLLCSHGGAIEGSRGNPAARDVFYGGQGAVDQRVSFFAECKRQGEGMKSMLAIVTGLPHLFILTSFHMTGQGPFDSWTWLANQSLMPKGNVNFLTSKKKQ